MKSSLCAAAAVLLTSISAFAQGDTQHHREVYVSINAAEASMKKVQAVHKDDSESFALTGWLQDGEVRKIVATSSGDGEGVEEFYLEDGKPLFVFSTYHQAAEDGKRGARIEERLYFKGDSIFKWLTTEKPAPVFHGEDYASMSERLTVNCAAFVAALKKKGKAGGGKAVKVTEGTFIGIEEGDYAHWNMRSSAGEELSFFILQTNDALEKVLEKPEAYAGRKCRVTWKKSVENIPEAGGKMEIEVILGVEWTGRK